MVVDSVNSRIESTFKRRDGVIGYGYRVPHRVALTPPSHFHCWEVGKQVEGWMDQEGECRAVVPVRFRGLFHKLLFPTTDRPPLSQPNSELAV